MSEHISVEQLCGLLDPLPDGGEHSIYRAIAQNIRALTVSGRLPLGAKLPSERRLADGLGVSRTTTAGAYRILSEAGAIATSHGRRAVLQWPNGTASAMLRSRTDDTLDLMSGAPLPQAEVSARLYREATTMLPDFFDRSALPAQGLPELRALVAARFCARGYPTSADQILITAGAFDALRQALTVLVPADRRVVVEEPTYPHAVRLLTRHGAPVHGFELDSTRTEAWNEQRLAELFARTRPDVFYTVPDGHNPTGAVMPERVRRAVGALITRSGGLLVVDETTSELMASTVGRSVRPLGSYVEPEGRAVTVGSLSKVFWPGLRIGWVRAAADTVAAMCLAPEQADPTCSVLDQLVATKVFENLSQVVELRRTQVEQSRIAVLDALAEHIPDAACVPGQGFTLWVRLPRGAGATLFADPERLTVRLSPGAQFGVHRRFADHIRIPLVQRPDVLREAVRRLGATLDGAPTATRAPSRR